METITITERQTLKKVYQFYMVGNNAHGIPSMAEVKNAIDILKSTRSALLSLNPWYHLATDALDNDIKIIEKYLENYQKSGGAKSPGYAKTWKD